MNLEDALKYAVRKWDSTDTPDFVATLWSRFQLDEETVEKLARQAFVTKLNLILTNPTRKVNFISVLDEDKESRIVRPIVTVAPREERVVAVQVLWDMQLQGATERKPFALFSVEDCVSVSSRSRAAASGLLKVAEITEYTEAKLKVFQKGVVSELPQSEQEIIGRKWQDTKEKQVESELVVA